MSNVTNVKAKRFTDGTAADTAAVAALQTLGGAGNLTLAGGASGTAIATFEFGSEGIDFYVPGSGILFDDGIYLDLTATPSVTITFT